MIGSNNLLFFYTAIRDNMHNPAVCLHGIALAELPSLYCHLLRSRGSLSKRAQQCHMHNTVTGVARRVRAAPGGTC